MEVMKISPRTQALMLLASALLGVAAGVMFDIVFLLRGTCRGGSEKTARYYRHSFPVIGQIKEHGAVGRFLLPMAHIADFLLPPAWAAAQMCVFYAIDDGVFRLSGILASLIGAFLWRKMFGRPFRACCGFLIFAVRVALAYLFYPFVFTARSAIAAAGGSASRLAAFLRERRIKKYSAAEWQRMSDLADDGFGLLGGDKRAPTRRSGNRL